MPHTMEWIKKTISFLSGNTKLYKDISCIELLKMCANYYEMDKRTVEKRINEVQIIVEKIKRIQGEENEK